MRIRLPARYGYPLVGVLFAIAGVVAYQRLTRPADDLPRPRRRPMPPVPAVVRLTFPPPSAADLIEGDPTADDRAAVDRVTGDLASADRPTRDRAAQAMEELPYIDLPLLEAVASRTDLPPAASEVMSKLMPRIRARAKFTRRRSHQDDAVAAFWEREALDEYAAGGHTNPKWDAAAQTFLHLANQRHAMHRPGAIAANLSDAQRQLRLTLDAGCDDPTVLACAGLLAADTGDPNDVGHDYFGRANKAARGGPLSRLVIDGRMMRSASGMGPRERQDHEPEITARFSDMDDQLNRLLDVPGLPPTVAVGQAADYFDDIPSLGYSLNKGVPGVWARLTRLLPESTPGLLALKGRIYTNWAWEARGDGWASSVTEQGWKDFHDRLDVASAALTKAYELDPDDPAAADWMTTVARGQEQGRNVMQTRFQRAMDANPDDEVAVWNKLEFLKPKWGGDPESMVRFGRQCLAQGNWRTNIPQVLVEVHDELAAETGDPNYWLLPGVWDDVSAVCAGYIERFPRDEAGFRARLARYGHLCHQQAAADALAPQPIPAPRPSTRPKHRVKRPASRPTDEPMDKK